MLLVICRRWKGVQAITSGFSVKQVMARGTRLVGRTCMGGYLHTHRIAFRLFYLKMEMGVVTWKFGENERVGDRSWLALSLWISYKKTNQICNHNSHTVYRVSSDIWHSFPSYFSGNTLSDDIKDVDIDVYWFEVKQITLVPWVRVEPHPTPLQIEGFNRGSELSLYLYSSKLLNAYCSVVLWSRDVSF